MPGERLRFRLGDPDVPVPAGAVTVVDAVSGQVLLAEEPVRGSEYALDVPTTWPSGLYRAVFTPGAGTDAEVWFVVRAHPRRRGQVLLSVPFATWQAYNRSGVPGEGLYWAEDPLRATTVSFDRPGGGPPPERWEEGMMRWLSTAGIDVDYCSDIDLHTDPDLLAPYRLLVVNGHDEYWTAEMRDSVESFTRRGGNLAVFGANTSWWQIRLTDDGRTMTCYRDAAADPVAATTPELTTVEWSAAPVHRPENAMTGLSFRLGAGCWGPDMVEMYGESYTVRFADHWVFEGTGLTDGDKFALGALGYETDAADIEEIDGVPRVTGRDGTPTSFTVLATADLRHWSEYGQAGAATMGVFESGRGTVFNAGTVNWGAAIGDPTVARITRNVLDRLSQPAAPAEWTVIGPRDQVRALAGQGSWMFAVLEDGVLAAREVCAQNLVWRPIEPAPNVVALAVPREAVVGGPHGLYAASATGVLWWRAGTTNRAAWRELDRCPAGVRSLAACDGKLYAVDRAHRLWIAEQGVDKDTARTWTESDDTELVAVASMNGRLYAIDTADHVLCRAPLPGHPWTPIGAADGVDVLTAHAGRLIGAGGGRPLRWRVTGLASC
ncbi:MAG TPA: N,N-dimethylformamidase beta subunit family domain-containing protein [Pseudonocardiaceae bacterium]|nr:N,N-dimethylformamidase beta subunit family domain-containing protein [Pseudonocardiaceae bacterium]